MSNVIVNKLKKYLEYGITKFKVWKNQKHFNYKNVDLKYMYKKYSASDTLVIVFSACTRPGLAARYNYVRTLKNARCNQLFILDDFGEDNRGSFYLGHMPEFLEQEACVALVKKFINDYKIKKIIFCGSCKGGFGALNIGSRFENSVMIVGEPVYHIASEFRLAKGLINYWIGEETDEKIAFMDHYLSEQLKNNKYLSSQKIHIFYSGSDEYYKDQTTPLLEDLHRYGYSMEEQTSDFKKHADLGMWFPEFLLTKLKEYAG